ncbi:hypothetical protein CTAYLR_005491 [Chrysophaeum taylorii]|uniref:RNase NYN domain-containing protein n=1 Tax=Chrysophaeum taylorii TaxID=2483200 RepID=A0AAD7XEJ0_9STRA|nr:hypothetical protein CTAYLR_005491 [Chrysophaeum taylorii]
MSSLEERKAEVEKRAELEAIDRVARAKAMGALFNDFRQQPSVIQMSSRMYGLERRQHEGSLEQKGGDAQALEATLRTCLASEDLERLERYARRGERALRSNSGSEAWRRLCSGVRDARARLAVASLEGAGGDEVGAVHARAAWAAHYKRLEGALGALKRRETSDASGLLADAADATEAFAGVLEKAVAVGAAATAHALLMALGDLERYRETYGDANSKAEALYLRALRFRPRSGRAAGMLATLASLRGESAVVVHWARRATIAEEPWEGGRDLLLAHAERCKKKAAQDQATKFGDCETHAATLAAACFTRVSGAGGLRATIERHASRAVDCLSALDATAPPSRPRSARRACLRATLTAILAARAAKASDEAPEVVGAATDAVVSIAAACARLPRRVSASAVLAFLTLAARDLRPLVLRDAGGNAAAALCGFLNGLDDDDGGCSEAAGLALDDDDACAGVLPVPSDGRRPEDDDDDEAAAERAARCLALAEDLVRDQRLLARPASSSRRRGGVDSEARFAPLNQKPLSSVLKALDIREETDSSESIVEEAKPASSSSSSEEEEEEEEEVVSSEEKDALEDAAPGRRRRRRPPQNRTGNPRPRRAVSGAPATAGVILSAMTPLPPQAFAAVHAPTDAPREDNNKNNNAGGPKLLFVIDAANVAMRFGAKGVFSTRGIAATMDYLDRRFERRCRFAIFLPEYLIDSEKVAAKRRAHELGIKQAKLQELPDDVPYLQSLERSGILVATPSQDYDDSYQIEYARRHAGVIVTNDMFRDAVDKLKPHLRGALREWMKTHLLSYTFVGEEFVPNPDFQFPVSVRIAKKNTQSPPPPPPK